MYLLHQEFMRVDHDVTCECAVVCFTTGAVVVVNSEECLIWLEEVLQSLWIPRGDTPTPYRGLPLVILALDDSIADSKLEEIQLCSTPAIEICIYIKYSFWFSHHFGYYC